ncbi:hypothetical protein CAFE_15580 [Caprobacter fermentans]|uniref:NAD-dependent epimerase/dehydratase domain-containing protein n=1 Tax=Caproicibacter fermentans TaxID=2576756 RepID=A0A6N8HZB0_9FIRM|nr:hypothetical protein [Caproicibacter fermentans]MVB10860.1 hypothetical protein [Caproicibacter fermentans]
MFKNEDCPLTACKQMWDFLYISDAAEGLKKLLAEKDTSGVYNFGSGSAKPLKDYVEEMAELTCTNSRLLFGAVPYGPAGMVSIEPVISRLVGETGWKPEISFKSGVTHVLQTLQ